MDFFRALLKGSLSLVLFSFVGNANALVVDFESTGISDIQNTYFDSNFNTTSLTTLNNVAFYLDGSMQVNAAGGIYFSEGVLLQNPSQLQTSVLQDLTGGSILYGTGESPSTNTGHNSALYPGYTPTNRIVITISPEILVTSVGGLLINGLNTDGVIGAADYQIQFYSELGLLDTLNFNDIASGSVPGHVEFFYESLASPIAEVIITGVPFDFGGGNGATEWDFLIDNIAFNEPMGVVPVPAALPLFISALAGVGLFARRRVPH